MNKLICHMTVLEQTFARIARGLHFSGVNMDSFNLYLATSSLSPRGIYKLRMDHSIDDGPHFALVENVALS